MIAVHDEPFFCACFYKLWITLRMCAVILHEMPLSQEERRNLNAFTSQYKHCMYTMVHAIYYTDAKLGLVHSIFF